MMRSAISPRLAMRILRNTASVHRSQAEQRLAELDRLAVGHRGLDDLGVDLGLDLVHPLHGLDDAPPLALAHAPADLDERLRVGARRAIEGADDRRAQVDQAVLESR